MRKKYDKSESRNKIEDLRSLNRNDRNDRKDFFFFFFFYFTLRKTTCLPRLPNFHDLHLRIYVEFIGNQVS